MGSWYAIWKILEMRPGRESTDGEVNNRSDESWRKGKNAGSNNGQFPFQGQMNEIKEKNQERNCVC